MEVLVHQRKFESEETSESSGDNEVVGDSHLTNSSDSEYESPNVEPENNQKDVEGLLQLLEVVEQQQTGGLSSMDFIK